MIKVNIDFEECFQAVVERDYDRFFSLSPFTTPISTPPPTRPTTPLLVVSAHNKQDASESLPDSRCSSPIEDDLADRKGKRAQKRARQRLNRKQKRIKTLMSPEVDVTERYNHNTHVKSAIPVRVAQDIGKSNVASTGYIGLDDSVLRPYRSFWMPAVGWCDGMAG
jgi:hypothetical protein